MATVEELRLFLTEQFRPYVREPEIYLRPVRYRPFEFMWAVRSDDRAIRPLQSIGLQLACPL